MKGTLFENQIKEYGDIFKKDNAYQISNAPLEPVNPKYKDRDGECSIRFGGRTIVQPVTTEIVPNKVHYVPLAEVSYESDPDDRYDILGLVLFISDIRTITSEHGIEHPVRDLSVIDHSTTVPMTVSIWDDITKIKDSKLLSWKTKPVIAGFLGLRVATNRVADTGELSLTAFAEDCEKLVKLPIIEIFEQTNTGTLDFGSITRDLSSNDFYVAVGPSYILTKKQVLSWVLKDVSWT
uniref:Uncharacterized protein n=1 Tax=Chenopodium quinoa TaxID=63459 RepID=A0A803MUC3_CHEQI